MLLTTPIIATIELDLGSIPLPIGVGLPIIGENILFREMADIDHQSDIAAQLVVFDSTIMKSLGHTDVKMLDCSSGDAVKYILIGSK